MPPISRRAALTLAWLPTFAACFALTPVLGGAHLPWAVLVGLGVIGLTSRVEGLLPTRDLRVAAIIVGVTFAATAVGWSSAVTSEERWVVIATFVISLTGGLACSTWILLASLRRSRQRAARRRPAR